MTPDERAHLMRQALDYLREATSAGGVATADIPVAALVIDSAGEIIGRGVNTRTSTGDPTAHAEVNALREAAAARGEWHLDDCTLVVTVEPCTMCAGAILNARIKTLIFGAFEPKTGAVGSVIDVLREGVDHHPMEIIGGVLAAEAAAPLKEFFESRR